MTNSETEALRIGILEGVDLLDDAVWKIRARLRVLGALDGGMSSPELLEGVREIACDIDDALEWARRHRLPWANPVAT